MVKYTIEYEDFDGNEKTKDLYFHLTEAELTLLNLSENGKYAVSKKDDKEIESDIAENIRLFEKLIEKAYGQKLEDGTFIKDENKKKAFLCSPEYSALIIKFINEDIKVSDFIIGCLPKKLGNQIMITGAGEVLSK